MKKPDFFGGNGLVESLISMRLMANGSNRPGRIKKKPEPGADAVLFGVNSC